MFGGLATKQKGTNMSLKSLLQKPNMESNEKYQSVTVE